MRKKVVVGTKKDRLTETGPFEHPKHMPKKMKKINKKFVKAKQTGNISKIKV